MSVVPSAHPGARTRLCAAALLVSVAPLCLAAPAFAATPAETAADATASDPTQDILVVGAQTAATIQNTPTAPVSIDAAQIRTTVNAVNVEDTLKYLPSLFVRKRHIGDTQSPLATRTSGVGSSARSLVYADGALLSALIGNNNTNASPRWSLVSPQEIAKIDVIYGPFSAAYPGNSIGAVVNITTRLPDHLEGTVTAGMSIQNYNQYGTRDTLPARQIGGTIGDRFGPLSLFASVDHVSSDSQPLLYVTAAVPAATSATGTPATGSFADVNRTGGAVRILGASGIENQHQDRYKLKAALDVAPGLRLTYVGGLLLDETTSSAETYLTANGAPAYSGSFNIDGRAYTIAPTAFTSGIYTREQRHVSHSLTASGSEGAFDWQVIGTLFDYDKDVQRSPTTAPPGAQAGGAGTIQRLDGTGWQTLDANGSVFLGGGHRLGFGAHYDRFEIKSSRYLTNDWRTGSEGALDLQSLGKTRTVGLWLQDAWDIRPNLTLTVGGRTEWWRAYDGVNYSRSPAISTLQPERRAQRFSPKATLAWTPIPGWTARASFGQASRFPTVGELYQIVTTPVPATPNPNLKPERARSEELALEKHDEHGTIRLAVFNEVIKDALVSQTGPLNGTTTYATFVQNIDRTRARGVEASFDRRDVLKGFDLLASVTYTDARTVANAVLPASVGRRLPQVPRWKLTAAATWHPVQPVSLTLAGRYSSRLWGTIDNSDLIGHTYMGFEGYFVMDARALLDVTPKWSLSVGVDNLNNKKYYLFHPFPQRTFTMQVGYKL
ncbi:TonB-dependent receptor [Sphingomonas sp. AP4-R1]|uniref:TonB-dependent receptor n=1 Tax=Sphingomonas sp. AP4-R1 TaxID=2735134 RepID=UPI001493365D|nr:TonB-dependent receptor [Sphingomonas sp. AP4-R1]QJU57584.1 TonB-dependent receptor [Sphingomonas sp. AP4-R1]